jgi:hypothetical protein
MNLDFEKKDRNMSNSKLNFTDTINQLPASPQSDQPGIKELLTELQTAIEAETNLSDHDKAEALEQVKTLAEVERNPQERTMQKARKTAMKILKGTIASLPNAATLVEACSKLLPAIETFDDSTFLELDEISSKITTNLNQLPNSPGLFQLVIDQLLKYYKLSIKAVEERYQAELKAKDAQIETYREEIAFLRELTVKLAKNPIVINSSPDNKPE